MVRLLSAQLLSLLYLCSLMLLAPYKRADNQTLAITSQLCLLACFMLATMMKVYKDLETLLIATTGSLEEGLARTAEIVGFDNPFSFSLAVFLLIVLITVLMVALMLKQGLAFRRRRLHQVREAVLSIAALKHPLAVCTLTSLRKMGKFTRFEEAREKGAIILFDTWDDALEAAQSHPIIFFSHQWLCWDEPDPNNVHYPVVLEAAELLRARLGKSADEILCWIDYSSIPQFNRASQAAAIDTIAAYAAFARYFVIVAPDTQHQNTKLPCTPETYLKRGWCRLEQWAAMAASGSQLTHMYLYERRGPEKQLVPLTERKEWIEESVEVFSGTFTVPGDKERLVQMVLGLYAFSIACGRADRHEEVSESFMGAAQRTWYTVKEKARRPSVPVAASDKSSTGTRNDPSPLGMRRRSSTSSGELGEDWLPTLISMRKRSIFPPEWFGDMVELLESGLDDSLEGKPCKLFSPEDFHNLLRTRQQLASIHCQTLPAAVSDKFGGALLEAEKRCGHRAWRSAPNRLALLFSEAAEAAKSAQRADAVKAAQVVVDEAVRPYSLPHTPPTASSATVLSADDDGTAAEEVGSGGPRSPAALGGDAETGTEPARAVAERVVTEELPAPAASAPAAALAPAGDEPRAAAGCASVAAAAEPQPPPPEPTPFARLGESVGQLFGVFGGIGSRSDLAPPPAQSPQPRPQEPHSHVDDAALRA